MPRIMPIRTLKNTSEISQLCHETDEPIFITKNGYGDMVVMSLETYEKNMYMNNIYNKLLQSEVDVKNGNTSDAFDVLQEISDQNEL